MKKKPTKHKKGPAVKSMGEEELKALKVVDNSMSLDDSIDAAGPSGMFERNMQMLNTNQVARANTVT